jgi:hypothetical protein
MRVPHRPPAVDPPWDETMEIQRLKKSLSFPVSSSRRKEEEGAAHQKIGSPRKLRIRQDPDDDIGDAVSQSYGVTMTRPFMKECRLQK